MESKCPGCGKPDFTTKGCVDPKCTGGQKPQTTTVKSDTQTFGSYTTGVIQ